MSDGLYDTIIIGGGMSGLAAGIRLAHFNQKVCILEKHSVLGGLNSFYKFKNYLFDVGLHAMTNAWDGKSRSAPLAKIYRQLRISPDDFCLRPQQKSQISFPDKKLFFTNYISVLTSEIEKNFPGQVAGFNRLVKFLKNFNEVDLNSKFVSAREKVSTFITEPLLLDMLFCPLMYYGSSMENDIDFGQFTIMFKALFFEGFCRPDGGVRRIIRVLQKRFRESGGELKLRSEVSEIVTHKKKVEKIRLKDGQELSAKTIFSSAGYWETQKLIGSPVNMNDVGRLSFVEAVCVLNSTPKELGESSTIIFYNSQNKFQYQRPRKLTDLNSGVICFPNNYQSENGPKESLLRITNLANYDNWKKLDRETYLNEKQKWFKDALVAIQDHTKSFNGLYNDVDVFSPTTVEKYTGHFRGAIYGATQKSRLGKTDLDNLFICGTDQGFLGITGAMLSGITMANLYALN